MVAKIKFEDIVELKESIEMSPPLGGDA